MAASDKKPSIYSERSEPVSFQQLAGSPSDTTYQPFRGFYVLITGNLTIMDWDGNVNIISTASVPVTGNPTWISGQRLMNATTATVLLLQ